MFSYETGCSYRFLLIVVSIAVSVQKELNLYAAPIIIVFFILLFVFCMDLNRQLKAFWANLKREMI